MNTSFSDLFKGFEEHKEDIEGNTENEEWLKYSEDYIWIQLGQRYQALKAHGEKHLHVADEEIAQVQRKVPVACWSSRWTWWKTKRGTIPWRSFSRRLKKTMNWS